MDWFANLSTIGDSLRQGEISSTELVDRLLEGVEPLNARLHALCHVLTERAGMETRRVDRRREAGVVAFAERLEQTLDLKVDYEVCV